RLRRRECSPPEVAPRPVAPAIGLAVEELRELHGGAHGSALTAVVGDARVGADAGTGQHRERTPADERLGRIEGGWLAGPVGGRAQRGGGIVWHGILIMTGAGWPSHTLNGSAIGYVSSGPSSAPFTTAGG